MLRIGLRKIKPEEEDRLRAWFGELMNRQDEVRETFRQETVRHEVAYIIEGRDGPVLIYAVEAEDHEQGRRAYETSTLPIDLEHRRVMKESLGEALSVKPVYECALNEQEDR